MKYLLSFLGFILAHTPERALKALCDGVAVFIMVFLPRRAAIAFSNLHHCFPDMDEAERKNTVFESCSRMVEMALFVVASPYIPRENLKSRITISDYVMGELRAVQQNPQPFVLMIPHFCMMETITMFPLIVDEKIPRTGVFYRPFDSASLEEWVRSSRERFGIELLSRKRGLVAALEYLKNDGVVAILYDQNAGGAGALSIFFDRLCSTSELPGLLVERTRARLAIFYARRTGFWRSEICGERLAEKKGEDITIAGNLWLEKKLSEDRNARFDWLWLHRRWNVIGTPSEILFTSHKRSILERDMHARGISEPPRGTRIFITAPDTLVETLALLPVVKLIRASRVDASVTLICGESFAPVVSMFKVADEVVAAPPRKNGMFARFAFFKRLSKKYPDIHLVIPDAPADDIDAFLLAAPMRLGLSRGRRRRFFKKVYSRDAASGAEHVALEYEAFARHFGARGEIDFSPLGLRGLKVSPENNKIAIICGGDGECAWSAGRWAELVKILASEIPGAKFVIFGEKSDGRLAYEILKRADVSDISNRAGKLNFSEFAAEVSTCAAAVAVDCDFAYAANAVGVPVVGLYGATNPVRNGFVFDAPRIEVVPDACPPQGGVELERLEPRKAADAVKSILFNKERL